MNTGVFTARGDSIVVALIPAACKGDPAPPLDVKVAPAASEGKSAPPPRGSFPRYGTKHIGRRPPRAEGDSRVPVVRPEPLSWSMTDVS